MATNNPVFPCSAVFRVPCSEIQNGRIPEHGNTAFSATFPCSGTVFRNYFQEAFRNTAEKAVFRCSPYRGGRVPEHALQGVSAALGGLAA
jgi:hypothetical protein